MRPDTYALIGNPSMRIPRWPSRRGSVRAFYGTPRRPSGPEPRGTHPRRTLIARSGTWSATTDDQRTSKVARDQGMTRVPKPLFSKVLVPAAISRNLEAALTRGEFRDGSLRSPRRDGPLPSSGSARRRSCRWPPSSSPGSTSNEQYCPAAGPVARTDGAAVYRGWSAEREIGSLGPVAPVAAKLCRKPTIENTNYVW